MPLVISHKAKCKYYIRSEEVLAEILGHSDFDGEYWAIGDTVVFEDGTEASIEQGDDEAFHVWSEPSPSDLKRVVDQINVYHPVKPLRHADVNSWDALFAILAKETEVPTKGCFALVLLLAGFGAAVAIPAVIEMG